MQGQNEAAKVCCKQTAAFVGRAQNQSLRCQAVKIMLSSVCPHSEVRAVVCRFLSGLFLLLGCFCIPGGAFNLECLSCWVLLVLCIS